jgi:hypothetical protein
MVNPWILLEIQQQRFVASGVHLSAGLCVPQSSLLLPPRVLATHIVELREGANLRGDYDHSSAVVVHLGGRQ